MPLRQSISLLIIFFFVHLHSTVSEYSINFELEVTQLTAFLHTTLADAKVTCSWSVEPPFDAHLLIPLFNSLNNTNKDDLIAALLLIKEMRQFSSATCSYDDEKQQVSIVLYPVWTFGRLYLKSTLLHTDKYKVLYAFETGDLWDKTRHDESILHMKQALESQGYMDCHIREEIRYEPAQKRVMTYLTIEHGEKYKISEVTISLQCNDELANDPQIEQLKKKLEKKIQQSLKQSFYNKQRIHDELMLVKKYLQKKGFINARITLDAIKNHEAKLISVVISIKLLQKKVCEVIGNSFFTTEYLQELFFDFGKNGLVLPAEIIAEEIKKAYQKKGFFKTNIQWYDEEERLIFCIDEGKRLVLDDIIFEGVSQWDSAALIKTYFKEALKNYYEDEVVQHALANLIQQYRNRGYWQVDGKATICSEADKNILMITITEGEQRKLSKVVVNNNQVISKNAYKKISTYFPLPQPFSLSMLKTQHDILLKDLHDQGYLYATIKPDLQGPLDAMTLCWNIFGIEQQVRFAPVAVTGSCPIEPYYLTRELAFNENDLWSSKKIDLSLKYLRALGIFDSVNLVSVKGYSNPYKKSLILRCEAEEFHEIKARGGLQLVGTNVDFSTATYTFGGTYILKNPFLRADKFIAQADVSRFQRDVELSYWTAWWMNIPLRTEYKIYSSRFNEPITPGSKHTLYKLDQNGFLINWTWDRQVTLGLNLGIEWMAITDFSKSRAAVIDFQPRLINRNIPYFVAEPMAFYENLDNKLYPTSGSVTMLTIKAMVPFDVMRAFLVKFLAEHSFFIPVSQAVLATRVRAGYIIHDSFSSIMPSERFYLGGAYSVRSYDTDLVPPLNILHCDDCFYKVAIGGKSMFNINCELRFPLYKSFKGVGFFDIGALAQDRFADIYLKKPACALGWGLRYNTAVGPLRFDIGWKILEPEAWRKFAWFLTFGHIF